MKPHLNESFESWSKRVERYEFGRALMRLAQGHNAETVMQETSQRIVNKLQHPVILAIQETVTSSYDPAQSLEEYKKKYLTRVGSKADHIKDD